MQIASVAGLQADSGCQAPRIHSLVPFSTFTLLGLCGVSCVPVYCSVPILHNALVTVSCSAVLIIKRPLSIDPQECVDSYMEEGKENMLQNQKHRGTDDTRKMFFFFSTPN